MEKALDSVCILCGHECFQTMGRLLLLLILTSFHRLCCLTVHKKKLPGHSSSWTCSTLPDTLQLPGELLGTLWESVEESPSEWCELHTGFISQKLKVPWRSRFRGCSSLDFGSRRHMRPRQRNESLTSSSKPQEFLITLFDIPELRPLAVSFGIRIYGK
jgi:hypothetical protein